MTVHRLQAQAVERALRTENCGVVHVMGPKERGPLSAGERRCVDPDAGEQVVYHVGVVPTHNARHACAACGQVSGGDPKRPRLAS